MLYSDAGTQLLITSGCSVHVGIIWEHLKLHSHFLRAAQFSALNEMLIIHMAMALIIASFN